MNRGAGHKPVVALAFLAAALLALCACGKTGGGGSNQILNSAGKVLETDARAFVVLSISGDGAAVYQNGAFAYACVQGLRIQQGDTLTTDADTKMYALLDDDRLLGLDPGTSVTVGTFAKGDVAITLNAGTMYYDVRSALGKDEKLGVNAGSTTMSIRGTRGVVSLQGDKLIFQLDEGKIAVAVDGKQYNVDSSRALMVTVTDAAGAKHTAAYTNNYTDFDFEDIASVEIASNNACSGGHHYVESKADSVAASCTKDGYTVYKCSVCGSVLLEIVKATGHNYVSTVKPPTCTEKGYTAHTCSVCGDAYTDGDTDALGHDYASTITTPAACTKDGVRTYTCSRCGDTYTETIPATGHSYVSDVTDPTCTEQGYTVHTCSICGDAYTDGYIDALGHDYTSEVTKPATCTEAGVRTYTCTRCGDTYTKAIPAKGHRYASKVTPPTCTKQGYTTHTCFVCGYAYLDGYTDALGHDYVSAVTTPATCTEDGVRTFTCTRCGDTYTEPIPAAGHHYVSEAVAPTCTQQGYTVHTCSLCGDTYRDEYTDALGHDYVSAVTTPATCTEDGVRTFTCTRCGDTYTEPIPAAGHQYVSEVVAPTCTQQGYTVHTCSLCGDTYRDEYTDALGHDYTYASNGNGTHTGTCSRCGDTVTEACHDGNEDGYCDICGYLMTILYKVYNGSSLVGTYADAASAWAAAKGHAYSVRKSGEQCDYYRNGAFYSSMPAAHGAQIADLLWVFGTGGWRAWMNMNASAWTDVSGYDVGQLYWVKTSSGAEVVVTDGNYPGTAGYANGTIMAAFAEGYVRNEGFFMILVNGGWREGGVYLVNGAWYSAGEAAFSAAVEMGYAVYGYDSSTGEAKTTYYRYYDESNHEFTSQTPASGPYWEYTPGGGWHAVEI